MSPLLPWLGEAWAEESCPSPPPSMPEAVGRTVPEVIRVEEMSINSSTRESNPYTLLVQCSRAGSEGVDVGELILRTRKPETWPYSMLIPMRGGIARTILKRSPGGEDRESWWTDQPFNCPGPQTGLVLVPFNIHPICVLLEYRGWGFSPVDPGMQDLHNTRQHLMFRKIPSENLISVVQ